MKVKINAETYLKKLNLRALETAENIVSCTSKEIFYAIQWTNHGDWYAVLKPQCKTENLDMTGQICDYCGNLFVDHGVAFLNYDWKTICPGDYLILDSQGNLIKVINKHLFLETYQVINETDKELQQQYGE